MNQIKHKHDWIILSGEQYTSSGKDYAGVFQCNVCKLKLHASDAIQLELWRNSIGWRSWLSVIAIVISFLALLVSLLK